jgi:TonB family protein
MRTRFEAAAAAVVIALAAGSLRAGPAPEAETLASSLIERAGGTLQPCDAAVRQWLDGTPLACAHVEHDWGAVKKALRRARKKLPELHEMPGFSSNLDGVRRSYLLAADGVIGIAFQLESKTLAVHRHHPCWTETELTWFEASRDDLEKQATPVHKTRPDYPEEARVHRATGKVVYHALVRDDGSVQDACVVGSSRRGFGFERAGLEALQHWRYPESKRGRLIPLSIEWTIH